MSDYSTNPASGPQSYSTGATPSGYREPEPVSKQSLPLAILGGFLASVVGAVVWGGITYLTGYKLGIVAIGVGFIVGYAVRYFGNGSTIVFGMIGAFFAVLGCALGNILGAVAAASITEGVPLLSIAFAFIANPSLVFLVLQETFSPKDILFYGIAIYEGFRFAVGNAPQQGEPPVSLGLNDPPETRPSYSPPPPPPPVPEAEAVPGEEKQPD